MRAFVVTLLVVGFAHPPAAQEKAWDVTKPRGQSRDIAFVTEEGTWMSVDVSPDGRFLVFDLLAHIYRVPTEGGEAECLTQDSGIALNYHPRFSPDGKSVAFVSDRGGQENLWIMDADGGNPRAVVADDEARMSQPAWTPDGEYIVARRRKVSPGFRPDENGLWMYHRTGGEGVELLGNEVPGASWPSISPDGRYLYFHVFTGGQGPGGHGDPLAGFWQMQRWEFSTGQMRELTAGRSAQQVRSSSGGAFAPGVSPSGKTIAFARRVPDGTISHKGHRFGPRTALWLRELETGVERMLMDPVARDLTDGDPALRVLPGYSWAPDGASLYLSQGGKLRRVDVATGDVATIPFTASVRRTISERAYAARRLSDEPLTLRFLRWPTASPDGDTLVFQAAGKLWLRELAGGEGGARRLTPPSFAELEYSPAWSPDGRSIAFTTLDETGEGRLWRVPSAGGDPQELARSALGLFHPAWSSDGRLLVVARGSGAPARGRAMVDNPWFDLATVDASGGPVELLAEVRSAPWDFDAVERASVVRPVFGPDGRVFFTERVQEDEHVRTHFVSVRADGTDRQLHVRFPFADDAAPSPDGKHIAFQEGDNVYVAAFPRARPSGEAPLLDRRAPPWPVTPLSRTGGLFPRWRDANTVEYGSGDKYFTYDVESYERHSTHIELSVPRYQPEGAIALTGARIITLDGDRIEDGDIVIEGARLQCVGACDTSMVDRTVDVAGKFIIPGFVDMHAHRHMGSRGFATSKESEAAAYLAYGVTSTLDNSAWSQNTFPIADLIETGWVVGPRTWTTGDPLFRDDWLRSNELRSYEDTEREIERLQSWGAVSIKQYLQPTRRQRQWIADVARRRKLVVTGEGGDLPYNLSMIMDGQTAWEHPLIPVPIYNDVAKFFGQARAVYSPTFVVGGPGPWNEEYFYQESDVWKDEKLRRFLPWRQLVPHSRRRWLRPETDYSYPLLAQGLADILGEGGHGAIGSHGQQHGIASHWEIWMAASALGSMGALELASRGGAYFLGLDRDLGSLEPGKLADLIVLRADPLADIRATTDIELVMKGGVLYDGDTLDEIWPAARAFGDYPWRNPQIYSTDDRPVDYWDKKP